MCVCVSQHDEIFTNRSRVSVRDITVKSDSLGDWTLDTSRAYKRTKHDARDLVVRQSVSRQPASRRP